MQLQLQNLSKKTVAILIIIILLVALLPSLYFYQQYKNEKEKSKSGSRLAKDEVQSLVKKVASHIELPKDEEPTVATVSDKTRLAQQPFFVNSEDGDKVLIYVKGRKAILYRPSTNKIIEVGPINVGTGEAELKTTPSLEEKVKVALYNGTETTGLTRQAEKHIADEKLTTVEVVAKENAKKIDYKKTLVIDLSGKNETVAQQLAGFFKGEVTTFPDVETKPQGADILIILGSEYPREK